LLYINNLKNVNVLSNRAITFAAAILGERTEKLEYTIKKLMDVAKELKESKKTADETNAMRLKKFGKR